MFKNLKYASFILLVGCVATNNQEKIYTDLIPTIVGEEEGDVSFIQDENLFVCNIDDKKGPQSFCDKDGKLFTGRVEMDLDDDDSLKIFYVFENGNVVKEENYENDKLISSSDVKLDNFLPAFPKAYSETFYNDNGTIKAIYKYDNDNRSSVLTVYCPDDSREKQVTVMQNTTTERIDPTKILTVYCPDGSREK